MPHSISKQAVMPILLFAGTLYISATLMFVLQPMFGKTLLPFLGGAPSVWNICMVFYQGMLFLGYLYAHYLSSRMSQYRQIQIHIVVIVTSLIVLPLTLPENTAPPTDGNPTFWLIGVLLTVIGLPLFVVSTTSPLLQKWFSRTGHRTSHDPYYLYATSNAGSMIALLSYPFLIEPNIGLFEQRFFWSIGYGLLCLLIIGCAVVLWRYQKTTSNGADNNDHKDKTPKVAEAVSALSWKTKLHWLALAFVPSSLLLGLTHFMSTDISPVPLLWIIPLVLYLLTFIIVFSRWADKIHPLMVSLQPIVLLPFIVFAFIDPATLSFWLKLGTHLLAFFVAVMVCHGEMAKSRPHTQHLTTFYLIMAFAGVLGGMFNTFVAPFIFSATYEYPIMIVVALLLRPQVGVQKLRLQILLPTLLLCVGIMVYSYYGLSQSLVYSTVNVLILLTGLSYAFRTKPVTFALLTAVTLFFSLGIQRLSLHNLHQERSFFGVISVRQSVLKNEDNRREIYHELYHGTTQHGVQRLTKKFQTTPLSYYSQPGPIGQLFDVFDATNDNWAVGIVGLGTGALVCYTKPQQQWTFYEIDPSVIKIAKNPNYFTYLKHCAKNLSIKLGDARLSLAKEADQQFDLLIIDAFSSDSVPTHLLTREAIMLYFTKLKPDGILALHITNRHLQLKKVVAEHARHLKLATLIQEFKPQNAQQLVIPTDWMVMARKDEMLNNLHKNNTGNWKKPPLYFGMKSWTDDFTNIVEIWR